MLKKGLRFTSDYKKRIDMQKIGVFVDFLLH